MNATLELQYQFAAHLRDPAQYPRPNDVEDRRMAIYRDLFYNNVEGLLAQTFPVLREITPDEKWHRIAREFYARHQCHTPLFREIPEEFITYLREERQSEADDPAFLLELAHYEWVELELDISDFEIPANLSTETDLLNERPVLSNLAWLLNYDLPVHNIRPDFQPDTPGAQPTLLLVYRDTEDLMHFTEINPVTARLVQLLGENVNQTGMALLTQLATEMQHPNPDSIIEHGSQILADLADKYVIFGSISTTHN